MVYATGSTENDWSPFKDIDWSRLNLPASPAPGPIIQEALHSLAVRPRLTRQQEKSKKELEHHHRLYAATLGRVKELLEIQETLYNQLMVVLSSKERATIVCSGIPEVVIDGTEDLPTIQLHLKNLLQKESSLHGGNARWRTMLENKRKEPKDKPDSPSRSSHPAKASQPSNLKPASKKVHPKGRVAKKDGDEEAFLDNCISKNMQSIEVELDDVQAKLQEYLNKTVYNKGPFVNIRVIEKICQEMLENWRDHPTIVKKCEGILALMNSDSKLCQLRLAQKITNHNEIAKKTESHEVQWKKLFAYKMRFLAHPTQATLNFEFRRHSFAAPMDLEYSLTNLYHFLRLLNQENPDVSVEMLAYFEGETKKIYSQMILLSEDLDRSFVALLLSVYCLSHGAEVCKFAGKLSSYYDLIEKTIPEIKNILVEDPENTRDVEENVIRLHHIIRRVIALRVATIPTLREEVSELYNFGNQAAIVKKYKDTSPTDINEFLDMCYHIKASRLTWNPEILEAAKEIFSYIKKEILDPRHPPFAKYFEEAPYNPNLYPASANTSN